MVQPLVCMRHAQWALWAHGLVKPASGWSPCLVWFPFSCSWMWQRSAEMVGVLTPSVPEPHQSGGSSQELFWGAFELSMHASHSQRWVYYYTPYTSLDPLLVRPMSLLQDSWPCLQEMYICTHAPTLHALTLEGRQQSHFKASPPPNLVPKHTLILLRSLCSMFDSSRGPGHFQGNFTPGLVLVPWRKMSQSKDFTDLSEFFPICDGINQYNGPVLLNLFYEALVEKVHGKSLVHVLLAFCTSGRLSKHVVEGA